MSETPLCRHCGGPLPLPLKGYTAQRGFCSARCNVAYQPQLRTVLCANTSCKKGEHGTRKVFTTYQTKARCCCPNCNKTQYEREAMAAKQAVWETRRAQQDDRQQETPTLVVNDLAADVIERRLEALARRRRQTRSWLRITDPWAQRPGSELHKAVTMDPYDLNAGAML